MYSLSKHLISSGRGGLGTGLPDEEDTLNNYHVHVFGKDLTLYKRWAKEVPQSGT